MAENEMCTRKKRMSTPDLAIISVGSPKVTNASANPGEQRTVISRLA